MFFSATSSKTPSPCVFAPYLPRRKPVSRFLLVELENKRNLIVKSSLTPKEDNKFVRKIGCSVIINKHVHLFGWESSLRTKYCNNCTFSGEGMLTCDTGKYGTYLPRLKRVSGKVQRNSNNFQWSLN
jgi:hypothetical protein